jgi:hypothetical protein
MTKNTQRNIDHIPDHKRNTKQCKFWQRCGEKSWECKLVQALWKALWMVFNKLKIGGRYNKRV